MRDEVLSREVFDTLLGPRKCLWSNGGENIIIYDRIAHWGIDLLPRRLPPRWERRYSAPLHLMPTRRGPTLEVVQSMEDGHNI